MRLFSTWVRLFDEAGDAQGGGGEQQQQAETPEQKIARLEREAGEFKKQAEENERKAKEHEESAKFWHEKARGSATAPGNRDGQQKPRDDEEEDDFIALAAQGPKAVKNWLKQQGLITREEAEQMTNAKAQAMIRQAEIVRNHPELNDQKSEFFKQTTEEYARLKARGVPEMEALEVAAELVAARRGSKKDDEGEETKGKGKGRQQETEEERRGRARAAAGEGRRGTQANNESDELTAEQKRICEAFGISEEQYKKRAKDGVQYAR
jgi:hypothetical protein